MNPVICENSIMQWKDVFHTVLTLDSKSLAAGIEWRLYPYYKLIQMYTDKLLGAERRLDRMGELDWQSIPVVINNFNRLICLRV